MNRRKQKKIELRIKKDKLRRKSNLLKKHHDKLDMLKKKRIESEEMEKINKRDLSLYGKFRKKLKSLKFWIIELTYIRLLNIFRNLFKKNGKY